MTMIKIGDGYIDSNTVVKKVLRRVWRISIGSSGEGGSSPYKLAASVWARGKRSRERALPR